MRIVIQRVKKASVQERGKIKAQIKTGLLVYLAIAADDTSEDVEVLVEKVVKLRLFPHRGKKHDFQQAIKEIDGEVLLIPNYTLYADLSGGNRPYFGWAASAAAAKPLYEQFVHQFRQKLGSRTKVKHGTFGEAMQVASVNNGPATLILETGSINEERQPDLAEDEYAEDFDNLLEKLGIELEI